MSLGETVQFYEVIDSCHFQVTMKRIAVDGGILFVCEQALKTDVEGVWREYGLYRSAEMKVRKVHLKQGKAHHLENWWAASQMWWWKAAQSAEETWKEFGGTQEEETE